MEVFASATETLNSYCASKKKENIQAYRLFEAELAKIGKLYYFKYMLRREREAIQRGEIVHIDLMDVPSGIRTVMVSHLGFLHENFDKNTIPEILQPHGNNN